MGAILSLALGIGANTAISVVALRLGSAALLATGLPAWRAVSVNPMAALRDD